MPVPGTRGASSGSEAGQGIKKGRKAQPDVQDIISGIVHLLGGKVNLNAASGESPAGSNTNPPPALTTGPAVRPPQPQSTRINNRAPPRLTEVPFEAIPLELGNSAGKPSAPQHQPQLPFGVPLRPPLWPPTVPHQSGQNVQELPFGSGLPLPVQLVPPVSSPSRPWTPPATLPPDSPAQPEGPALTVRPNITSISKVSVDTGPTISFFPEDHAVRHPPSVLTIPTSSPSPVMAPVFETSSLDSILQPSIEDVTTTTTTTTPAPTTPVAPAASPASPPSPPPSIQGEIVSSSAILPVPEREAVTTYTPPLLPGSRPGQVFHDEYLARPIGEDEPDVITSDNIHPTYGDTFDLVVTAAQSFGGGTVGSSPSAPPIVAGKPYVIPVDIDHVRGGPLQPSINPTVTSMDDSDQYVSIDGRKTYFNLFPTDVPDGPAPMVQATSLPNRLPVRE